MARTNQNEERQLMVESQIRRRGISNEQVLKAMESVPRHQFVSKDQSHLAYADCPLPIGHRQTISQPYIVAYMTEQLQVEPDHRVLEIGTGCGYQTAILAELVREVYSLEVIPELAEAATARLNKLGYQNISITPGNGRDGWPGNAPFDRIIVTAAPSSIPPALISQLAAPGKMIIPVGHTHFNQNLELVQKNKVGAVEYFNRVGVRFVPLV